MSEKTNLASPPQPPTPSAPKPIPSVSSPGGQRAQSLPRLALALLVLALCFSKPLYDLIRLALGTELYSHLLLIPFISLYLIWLRRREAIPPSAPAVGFALIPLVAGFLSLVGYWISRSANLPMNRNDHLAFTLFAFVCLVIAACGLFLGRHTLRLHAFPLAFLFFLVPFPTIVENGIEIFFQHTSAHAAHWMLSLSGMPVVREGLNFQLPGFQMRVAQECSGIRSSLVLFITSLVAGQLFLRSPWKRTLFTVAVIPLGIVRNGFRIWTIGQLCVRIGPEMIDSPIHRKGGPIFFLLSLVPFFLLLLALRKSESNKVVQPATKS